MDLWHCYCMLDFTPNQYVLKIISFSVSWIPCTRFYVFIRSTGDIETNFAVFRAHHHVRYLILNFGNVVNLDMDLWCVDSTCWMSPLIRTVGH